MSATIPNEIITNNFYAMDFRITHLAVGVANHGERMFSMLFCGARVVF